MSVTRGMPQDSVVRLVLCNNVISDLDDGKRVYCRFVDDLKKWCGVADASRVIQSSGGTLTAWRNGQRIS